MNSNQKNGQDLIEISYVIRVQIKDLATGILKNILNKTNISVEDFIDNL